MVEAAVSGAIDFSRADPQDIWWWRKLRWTIDELARQRHVTMSTARQQHWLAHLGAVQTDDAKQQVAEQVVVALRELNQELFPWVQQDGPQDAATALRDLWVSVYGDPKSPEAQAVVQRGIAEMQRMQARKKARKAELT